MDIPENEEGDGGIPAAQAEGSDSFYLPKDFPGSDGFKPGDKITLTVVGKDETGDLEVKCDHGPEQAPEEGEHPAAWEGLDEHMQGGEQPPEGM